MKLFLKNTLVALVAILSFVNTEAQNASKKRIDGVVGVVGALPHFFFC